MAAHAIKAGEGDVFLAGGVEAVSRFGNGMSDGMPNTRFAGAHRRTESRALGGGGTWAPADGLADVYIEMGQTAENVREVENVSRHEMDRFAALSQNRAVESQTNGFFEREISPLNGRGDRRRPSPQHHH